MTYVDGFLAAVPTARKQDFIEHAGKASRYFKANGALQCIETWGDDVPDGEVTSFPMAVKCKPDETVVFSWIVWPDKATRDANLARMMSDEAFMEEMKDMPFDGKRMMFGGFAPVVEA